MTIGKYNKIILEEDIKAYILQYSLNNHTKDELISPIAEFIEKDKTYDIGVTHVVTLISSNHERLITIPKGTPVYIQNVGSFIIPELFYITDQKISKSEKRDLSKKLDKYGVDVYTKNGERHKVTSGDYNIEDVLGIFADDNTIINTWTDRWEGLLIADKNTQHREFTTLNALSDMNGYENTQILKENNKRYEDILKDKWYIPSCGELDRLKEKLGRINLTLQFLGKGIIYGLYKTSTIEYLERRTFALSFNRDCKTEIVSYNSQNYYNPDQILFLNK